MDNSTDRKGHRRRSEWVIERLVPRKLIWVRIAKTRIFTIKGAVGYASRLRKFYPDSQYRFRHIDTADVIPSELFGV